MYCWIIYSDLLTFLDFVSNVEGSILGNNLRATGSKNSINGTTRKTRKGTKRKRSAHIRRNWKKKNQEQNLLISKILNIYLKNT